MNEKFRGIYIFVFICSILLFSGCATQPVVWTRAESMDLSKGGQVEVKAVCDMPSSDVNFLQTDIHKKVSKVLSGNVNDPDTYKIEVIITKYDEGNAFARFMLIGLGQMYLDGTVEIKQGEPPIIIRTGEFKKNYCVGGIAGGMATMQKDVLPEVGKAIAAAIKAKK